MSIKITLKKIANQIPSTIKKRSIWICPVQAKNPMKSIKDSKKDSDYNIEECQKIISQHIIYGTYNQERLILAARKLDLIENCPCETIFWRGESIHEHTDIPYGIHQIDRNTSITPDKTVANSYKRYRTSLYNHLNDITLKIASLLKGQEYNNPKAGRIINVIVSPNAKLIRIIPFSMFLPEYEAFSPEYVIPKGALIESKNNGCIIRVLSCEEEEKERLKIKNNLGGNT